MRKGQLLSAALATILFGAAAWGQSQNQASGSAEKVDRAAAYYHYTLAQMYSEMAGVLGPRHREYMDKAIEELHLAIKADPQLPILREELATGPGSRRFAAPLFLPSPPRQRDGGANPK